MNHAAKALRKLCNSSLCGWQNLKTDQLLIVNASFNRRVAEFSQRNIET